MLPAKQEKLDDFHELVFFGDRVAAIRQTLKRLGRDGRRYKFPVLYVGVDTYQQGRQVQFRLMPDVLMFLSEVRYPKRVLGWHSELKIKGDFEEEWIYWVAENLESAIAGNPIPIFLPF